MTRYNDIELEKQFIDDWDTAPHTARKSIDKIIRMTLTEGYFPNSCNIHRADTQDDLWIAYVTRSRAHWRLLFKTQGSTIIFHRLVDHDTQDDYLRWNG